MKIYQSPASVLMGHIDLLNEEKDNTINWLDKYSQDSTYTNQTYDSLRKKVQFQKEKLIYIEIKLAEMLNAIKLIESHLETVIQLDTLKITGVS